MVGLYDFKGTGRAQRHAAVAGYALGLVRLHAVVVGVPKVYFVRALTLTGAAVDAAVVVADDLIPVSYTHLDVYKRQDCIHACGNAEIRSAYR